MPNYIFTYHQPTGYVPGSDSAAMAAWQAFFEGIGQNVVEPGQPVFERRTLGEVGASTQLGGYSVVTAADFEEAITLAKGCPSVAQGGGVVVGALADLPPDHVAERLRQRLSRA
ncbi:MAG TPA: hypothetical protein VMU14_19760 [Acidimicrobiales bacterium]|nr:hypothetical protein [Acidimicrobiales bacterium]